MLFPFLRPGGSRHGTAKGLFENVPEAGSRYWKNLLLCSRDAWLMCAGIRGSAHIPRHTHPRVRQRGVARLGLRRPFLRLRNGVRTILRSCNVGRESRTVVALPVATVTCFGAVVGTTETTSWVHALFLVVAVLSGLVWLILAGTFLLVAVVVTAVRARRITFVVDVLLAMMSLCVGGAVGLETYESGPGALVIGPAGFAVVAVVGWSRLSSRAARIRLIALASLGGAAAVAVGSTAFL